MKLVINAALALLVVIGVAACMKDSTDNSFSISGKWNGKIGQNTDAPAGQFSLNIKLNGTIERINSSGSVVATGTWMLAGNNFSSVYSYTYSNTIVNVDATLDKGQNKLTGGWSNNSGEQGTWTTSKSN